MGAQSSTLSPTRNASAEDEPTVMTKDNHDAGAFPFDDPEELAVVEGGDDMWLEELEPAAAAAEVAALSRPASPPPNEWRRDQASATPKPPSPMAAPAFATARELQTRRWARLRAEPANMEHVPPELHPEILVHASVSTLARLALCSSVWNRAVAKAVRTKRQWLAIYEEHDSIAQMHTPNGKYCAYYKSVHHLFGALFCRCDGPAVCVEMLKAMQEASEASTTGGTQFCELTIDYLGVDAFATRLAKCPRASEWTEELILSSYLAASERGDSLGDNIWIDDADTIVFELRELVFHMRRTAGERGFRVEYDDLIELVIKDPKMITTTTGRSHFIMQSYGKFYDGYEFDETDGIRMGSAVAAMDLPIEQIVNLFDRLDDVELEAQDGNTIDTHGHVATTACITVWAQETGFPFGPGWEPGERQVFFNTFAGLTTSLKRNISPVVQGWILSRLEALQPFLGNDDCPDMTSAVDMLTALMG